MEYCEGKTLRHKIDDENYKSITNFDIINIFNKKIINFSLI
jgi:hypothetical protein